MAGIGKPERITQERVIALFRDALGYRFLGDWTDRAGNSNIDEGLLTAWLGGRGHTPEQIARVLHRLRTEADNPNRGLYANNQAVYSPLRYGVQVKTEAGKVTDTVFVIDWECAEANDFVIVEEVTLEGGHERGPDLVLYVNGIAIAVLELKNSRVSIGDGIRQLLSNQQPAVSGQPPDPPRCRLPRPGVAWLAQPSRGCPCRGSPESIPLPTSQRGRSRPGLDTASRIC